MVPIVHGLEKRFANQIAFLYFDISETSTADIQKTLRFRATPHFFLLAPDGKILSQRMGIITEPDFERWLKTAVQK